MRLRPALASLLIALAAVALHPGRAEAHQPYFEERDFTFQQPFALPDTTVSRALYATLSSPEDVDYYTFTGRKGESVPIGIVIPQIAGQQSFAPTVALLGPGLPGADLPSKVSPPPGTGALVLAPPEKATTFFEPFSRTRYWRRQEATVTLPADGTYYLAVYHPAGEVGRYVLSVGSKEVRGGDPSFRAKLRRYWRPLTRV